MMERIKDGFEEELRARTKIRAALKWKVLQCRRFYFILDKFFVRAGDTLVGGIETAARAWMN